jgi:16S rRNA G966 N2-methylase RsmD
VQVQRAEALAVLRTMPIQRWDVVFLDPPFLAGENEALFQAALASARRCIAPQGWLHLEAPRAWTSHELAALGWRIWRVGKAGAVHHHLLQPDDIR